MHVFYYCTILSQFWKYIEDIVKKYSYNTAFQLEPQIFIYGFNFKNANLIDLVINYALLSIYRVALLHKQGKTPNRNEFIMMFKLIIKKRFQIEKHKRKQRLFVDLIAWEQLLNVL